MGNNFLKADNMITGLIIGFVLPFAGVILFYFWKVYPNEFGLYLKYLSLEKRLLSSLTVICLLLNIVAFTFYVNRHLDKTAKGIFSMTILISLISLGVKFLG